MKLVYRRPPRAWREGVISLITKKWAKNGRKGVTEEKKA